MCSSASSWVWSRSNHVLIANEPLQNLFKSVPRPPLQEGLGADPSAAAIFAPAQTKWGRCECGSCTMVRPKTLGAFTSGAWIWVHLAAKSSSSNRCEHNRAVPVHCSSFIPQSTWKGGLRHSSCVLGHGTDQVWKQPCPGMHESCLRPLVPNNCSIWQPVTFKAKYGCTRWWSWKYSQVVDVGVSTVKNNMHSNKEDSAVHGSAEAVWTGMLVNK